MRHLRDNWLKYSLMQRGNYELTNIRVVLCLKGGLMESKLVGCVNPFERMPFVQAEMGGNCLLW